MAQGNIRYRCFLPDLTGFAASPCTGPSYQQSASSPTVFRRASDKCTTKQYDDPALESRLGLIPVRFFRFPSIICALIEHVLIRHQHWRTRSEFGLSGILQAFIAGLHLASIHCPRRARCNPPTLSFSRESAVSCHKATGTALAPPGPYKARSDQMADLIFVLVTVLFFLISWLYATACDRL